MRLSKHAKFYKLKNNQYVVFNNLIFEPIVIDDNECRNLKSNSFSNFNEDEVSILIDKGILGEEEQDKEAEEIVKKYFNEDRGVSLAYLIPTNMCNLKCKYCFIGKLDDKDILTIEEKTIINAIDKLYEEKKDYNIDKITLIFYGGEPLLALSQIEFACKYCELKYKNNFEFAIVTNATLINEEAIDLFKKYNFSVGVSIDGPKHVNDKNRLFKNGNASVYDIVENKLKLLINNNIDIGLSVTLTQEVLDDNKFLAWISNFGIKDISYNLLHFNEKNKNFEKYYKQASKFLFDSDRYLKDCGIVDDRLQRKVRAFHSREIKLNDCAAVGGHQICICPNGDVTVCHGYWHRSEDRCGNINTDTLKDIKNAPNFKKWKGRTTANNDKCLNCPGLYICGGGCYLQSQHQYGDSNELDKGFCIHTLYTLKKLLKKELTK